MKTLSFTIPGEPIAKARPRATTVHGHARMYTPKKSAAFEDRVSIYAQEAGAEVLDGPVAVTLRFWSAWPKTKWRKRTPRGEAWKDNGKDVDNLAKAVLDGLNGVAWHDDRQVVLLEVSKLYTAQGKPARVEVEVWPLEAY